MVAACFSINWSYYYGNNFDIDPIDAMIMFEFDETDQVYFVTDILCKGDGFLPNLNAIKEFLDEINIKYVISNKFNIRRNKDDIFYEFNYDT